MERVIALLSEKNSYLEKFYLLNEQELINFGEGNFDTVSSFYEARDKILDLIKVIDSFIAEENTRVTTGAMVMNYRAEVESMLINKDEMVKSILAQDLQILSYIEREKSNIIRELKATSQAKRAVGAYASAERLSQLDSE